MNVGREISACARDESVKPLLLRSLHVRGIAPYIKSALWRQIQKKSCTRNTLDLKEAAHTQIKLSGMMPILLCLISAPFFVAMLQALMLS